MKLWAHALNLLARYDGGGGPAGLPEDLTGVPAALLLELIKAVLGLPR